MKNKLYSLLKTTHFRTNAKMSRKPKQKQIFTGKFCNPVRKDYLTKTNIPIFIDNTLPKDFYNHIRTDTNKKFGLLLVNANLIIIACSYK